jgi:hypothetical protein
MDASKAVSPSLVAKCLFGLESLGFLIPADLMAYL